MTELFNWEPRYQLDVKSMDDDHKKLIELMNRLHVKYESKASPIEQGLAFDRLAEFTGVHFAAEEAYMASVGFPGLETHKLIHKSLLQKVGEFGAQFEKTRVFPPELFGFLKTWLAAHIVGIDTKYAHHAHGKPGA